VKSPGKSRRAGAGTMPAADVAEMFRRFAKAAPAPKTELH
jgi:hypothetical protein